jgi:hypothetical protein
VLDELWPPDTANHSVEIVHLEDDLDVGAASRGHPLLRAPALV